MKFHMTFFRYFFGAGSKRTLEFHIRIDFSYFFIGIKPIVKLPETMIRTTVTLTFIHTVYHECGMNRIHNEEDHPEPCERYADGSRNPFDHPAHAGVQLFSPEHSKNSPEKTINQIDPSMQIQRIIPIIPGNRTDNFFLNHGTDIFVYAAKNGANQKQQCGTAVHYGP